MAGITLLREFQSLGDKEVKVIKSTGELGVVCITMTELSHTANRLLNRFILGIQQHRHHTVKAIGNVEIAFNRATPTLPKV